MESEKIFISYARIDGTEHAYKLADSLPNEGFFIWIDKRGIDPTQDYTAEIENAIESASFIVTCITPDVKRSNSFVRREIGYALLLDKRILVARFKDMIPPITVVNHTWINFYEGWDPAYQSLCTILKDPHKIYLDSFSREPFEERPFEDPYKPFLKSFYQNIVQYLNKAVFSMLPQQNQLPLITLHSQAVSDAVESDNTNDFHFTAPNDSPSGLIHDSFYNVFTHYEGRILLLGEPGSGKTITLMAFARDVITRRLEDHKQPLPLLIPVRLWNYEPLEEFLTKLFPSLKDDLDKILTEGKVILIFDGLDELPERKVVNELPEGKEINPCHEFLKIIPQDLQVVVSSRREEYYALKKKIKLKGAVLLQPLKESQIQEYLQNLPDLWRLLNEHKGLKELVSKPLLLNLFAYGFTGLDPHLRKIETLKIDEIQDLIFESFVNRRYDHDKKKTKGNLPFTLEEVREYLGFVTSSVDGNVWVWNPHPNSYKRYLVKKLGEEKALEFIQFATLLDLIISDDESNFRFIHLLFRDYFARNFALNLIKSQRGPTRRVGIIMLKDLGDTKSVESLIPLFKDTSYTVRWHVVNHFCNHPDKRVIKPLISALGDLGQQFPMDAYDQSPRVYYFADLALTKLGSVAVEELVNALKDENIENVDLMYFRVRDFNDRLGIRVSVASSLSSIGDPRSNQPLKEFLKELKDLKNNKNFKKTKIIRCIEFVEKAIKKTSNRRKTG